MLRWTGRHECYKPKQLPKLQLFSEQFSWTGCYPWSSAFR